MSDKNLNERLKKIIKETGLSQIAFAKKYGFSQSSLSLWISGKRTPSHASILELIKAFKEEGIPSSSTWAFNDPDTDFELNDSLDIMKEISILKKIYENFSVFFITDDSMSPRFLRDEYVGGILSDSPEHPEATPYIIETLDGYKGVRHLSFDETLNVFIATATNSNYSSMTIPKNNLLRCHKIFWHRLP